MKPAWLKRRDGDAVKPPRERGMQQVNHTGRVLALLEARLLSHGAADLPAWLRANVGGMRLTDRVCVLQRIMREGFDRDIMQDCRDMLA